MWIRFNRTSMACLVAVIVFASVAYAQDCPYKDEFGDPTMSVGGESIAAAVTLLGGQGIDIPDEISGPYAEWDLNDDGILDSDQFVLLTELLCLPEGVVHPAIDIVALRAAFEQNLAAYWNMINGLFDNEDAIIAAAPLLRNLSIQLRAAATAAGMINTVIAPEVFANTELPAEWVGKTYKDLADVMLEMGDGVIWMVNEGYLGTPFSLIRTTLDNIATAHLLAAVMGLDEDLWTSIMSTQYFLILQQGLVLVNLDWDYLLSLFQVYGLDPDDVAETVVAIEESGISPELIPDPLEDLGFLEWGDTFDGYTGDLDALVQDVLNTLESFTMPVRVVHASPDAPVIDVCQNEQAFIDSLAFGAISPYADAEADYPDFRYGFSVVAEDADCADALLTNAYDLANTSTLVVLNTLSNLEYLMLNDDNTIPANGKAKLRFVHASPDAGPISVTAKPSKRPVALLFNNFPFKGVGSYTELAPGAYTLDFVIPGKGVKVLPPADIVLNSGTVYTVFAMGLAGSVDALVNTDATAGSVTVTTSRNGYLAGETITLSSEVGPGITPSAYAWYRDGVLLDGTAPELVIENAVPGDAGTYTAIVTAGVEGILGNVQVSGTAAPISVTAASVTILGRREYDDGEDIQLTASLASGLTGVSYAWTWSGGLLDGVVTDEPLLTVLDVTVANNGNYQVESLVELDGYPGVQTTVTASAYIRVGLSGMPLASLGGLALLTALCGVAGINRLTRRK